MAHYGIHMGDFTNMFKVFALAPTSEDILKVSRIVDALGQISSDEQLMFKVIQGLE